MPADYAALSAAWNSTTLPSGVTGTALTAQMTPEQKLVAINAWTMAGAAADVAAAQVRSAWYATGAWAKVRKRAIAAAANIDTSAAGLAALMIVELALAGETIAMSNSGVSGQVQTDMAALVTAGDITSGDAAAALALTASSQAWWHANSFPAPLNLNDVTAAGLS